MTSKINQKLPSDLLKEKLESIEISEETKHERKKLTKQEIQQMIKEVRKTFTDEDLLQFKPAI